MAKNAKTQGASRHKSSSNQQRNDGQMESRFKIWVNNHNTAFRRALFHLTHSPFASLITILVIATALTLPAGFQIVFANLQGKEQTLMEQGGISIFMTQTASSDEIENVQSTLKTKPEIAQIKLLSSADALQEFQSTIGIESDSLLGSNPLPAVIYATLNRQNINTQGLKALQEALEQNAAIDIVQIDADWIQQLYSIVDLVKNASILFSLFLIFTVIVIIGNTVRLLAQHYQDEILISKLVGATDAYVRRPFLYSGFLFGFSGGITACLFIGVGFLWLNPEIEAVMRHYGEDLTLRGLNLGDISSILVIGTLLGVGGAWIASNRIINEISI